MWRLCQAGALHPPCRRLNSVRLEPTLVGLRAFGGLAVVMAACGVESTLVVTHDGFLWGVRAGVQSAARREDDNDSRGCELA